MRQKLRALWLRSMKTGSATKWWTVVQAAKLAGTLRSTRQIISTWPAGIVPLSPRVALFMHFDRNGNVCQPVMSYLTDLFLTLIGK